MLLQNQTHHVHYVDRYVGHKIRERRLKIHMDQSTLAEGIGVSFQQIQKYERGINRVSASRLYDISVALGVNINYFFDQIEQSDPDKNPAMCDQLLTATGDVHAGDPMKQAQTLDLVSAWLSLPSDEMRKKCVELLKTAMHL